jgi:Family of unknown function (DUF7000)
MKSLQKQMNEYKKQLEKGDIQEAYRGLIKFMKNLRMFIKNRYPDYVVSGSVQNGNMDYSYFHFTTPLLKSKSLKIVILFAHEKFQFEVWLCGLNKNFQKKYLEIFTENGWDKYRLATSVVGEYSIIDSIVVDNPDFSDLDALTEEAEIETMIFLEDIENFLTEH